MRERWAESKVLRLEIADDGSGISDGDLDVGFHLQASALEDRFAFLEHAPNRVEGAVERMLDLRDGIVDDGGQPP